LVVTADDLNQLREKISTQEQEIKHLQQSVEEQRLSLEQALQNSGQSDSTVGFVVFTWYGRSTNVASGIGARLGAIPFNDGCPSRRRCVRRRFRSNRIHKSKASN
jgi:hypothetical protein